MELEPRPEQPPATVTDADREAAAERLADAAGNGGLTLSEFSDRVGAVWAAETSAQLATATAGIELPPPVGVELTGFDLMGDRELALAPVPRVPGTPLIRVRAHAVMG